MEQGLGAGAANDRRRTAWGLPSAPLMHEQSLAMKAFFFGDPERRLFGIHHPARASTRREAGVVLCYPGAQEYGRSHTAYRKLASLLAAEGFDVLRFDYFGTGDSAGESNEAELDTAVASIETASRELLDAAEVTRLSLVGMRLGAPLALQAAARLSNVRQVVLWDPVIRGSDYLRELEAAHESQSLLRLQPLPHREPPWDELLGFPCTAHFRCELESLHLTRTPARTGTVDVVWTGGGGEAAEAELEEWAARPGIRLRIRRDRGGDSPGERVVQDGILVVDKALGSIVEALVAGPEKA